MRIYFIGAHSTGKTTLARTVSQHWNLPFLNEIARTILAEKELSVDNLRANIETVNAYQEDVYLRQFEEEKKHESFVSDRSFDNLAYMAQHSTILAKFINERKLIEYIDTLRKSDAVLFFVRPSRATMKADGVRETLVWDNIVAIDAMIKLLLEMFALTYVCINTDSMQERIRTVNAVLKLV